MIQNRVTDGFTAHAIPTPWLNPKCGPPRWIDLNRPNRFQCIPPGLQPGPAFFVGHSGDEAAPKAPILVLEALKKSYEILMVFFDKDWLQYTTTPEYPYAACMDYLPTFAQKIPKESPKCRWIYHRWSIWTRYCNCMVALCFTCLVLTCSDLPVLECGNSTRRQAGQLGLLWFNGFHGGFHSHVGTQK